MSSTPPYLERELKLALPEGARLPRLDTIAGVTAQVDRPKRFTTEFFDTPDHALAAWGVLLRHRSKEGWLVKLPDSGGRLTSRSEIPFAGDRDVIPAAALELLTAYHRGRPASLSARIRTIRRRMAFVDERGVELIELVDDRVTALEPDAGRAFRQVEIELRDPDASDVLDDLAERLEAAGARPDPRTKYGWALGDRLPRPEVEVPDAGPDATVREVLRAGVGAAVRQLIDSDAAVREGSQPEAIHAARVATRRLRSHLRTFGQLVDPAWATPLRSDLRIIGDALGRVRDTQVLAERLRSAAAKLHVPGADDVGGVLDARLAAERETLRRLLSDAHYIALLDRLVHAAISPAMVGDPDLEGLAALRPIVRRAWRRLRKRVRDAGDAPTDEQLHRIRIEAKRARYAAEVIAPLAGKPAAAFARAAARLQDVLGEHQDAVVAWEWLHHSATEGLIDAFTAGELAGLQLEAREDARERWRKALKNAQVKRPSTW